MLENGGESVESFSSQIIYRDKEIIMSDQISQCKFLGVSLM